MSAGILNRCSRLRLVWSVRLPYPVDTVWSRTLCTTEDGSVARSRTKKPRLPDTPYVLRRHGYQEKLREARKTFAVEVELLKRKKESLVNERLEAASEGKHARQREKSEMKLAVYQKNLAERAKQKKKSLERRAFNFKLWEDRCKVIETKRLDRLAALDAASSTWITESNLPEKVDEMMDSIFIAQEAAEGAIQSG